MPVAKRRDLLFVNFRGLAGSPLDFLREFFQGMEMHALVYSDRFRVVVVLVVFDGDHLKGVFRSGLFRTLPVQVNNIMHWVQSFLAVSCPPFSDSDSRTFPALGPVHSGIRPDAGKAPAKEA